MTLAHFASNNFADSMTGMQIHTGLSKFGRELVREMNRIGMIVDVSHISDKAVLDAVEKSRAPVIASHSSVKAIAPIVRNMPDNVIKAIAKRAASSASISTPATWTKPPTTSTSATARPAMRRSNW